MSCAICLESYLDQSQVPDAERHPYFQLNKQNLAPESPKSQGCCFIRARSRDSKNTGDLPDAAPEQRDLIVTPRSEEVPVATRCGHVFHLNCITNWSDTPSKGKRGCPICRETIVLKNLIKLHLDTMRIVRHDSTVGVLVSMSLNQYNTLKEGFSVGYHNGEEKFEEIFQAKIKEERGLKEQAQNEVFKLKAEHAAAISKLGTENTASMARLRTEHGVTITKLREEHSAANTKLKSEFATKLKKLSIDCESVISTTVAEMEKLKTENAAELAKIKTEQATQLEKLTAELEKVKAEAVEMQKVKIGNVPEVLQVPDSGNLFPNNPSAPRPIKRKSWDL